MFEYLGFSDNIAGELADSRGQEAGLVGCGCVDLDGIIRMKENT